MKENVVELERKTDRTANCPVAIAIIIVDLC